MTYDALDEFAGPGGWDEGARMVGLTTVGLELDRHACRTAVAAGHPRIRTDVSRYPSAPFAGISGYIASPPCQAWSMAGKRKGEYDRANCHTLADRIATGDDSTDWTTWEDDRSPLVCHPLTRIRDIHPAWVALEEVPQVAGLWEHFARILRGWGYHVWTGDLLAADYGVPQTRLRRILMGSLAGPVAPPAPTHAENPAGIDLFGDSLEPWVCMADALGWHLDDAVQHHRGAGMIERYGDRDPKRGSEPSMTVTSKTRSWKRGLYVDRGTNSKAAQGRMEPTVPVSVERPAPTFTGKSGGQWVLRMGNRTGATVRTSQEPAPTVLFGHRSNKVEWYDTRPATTIVGSFNPDVVSPPGYRTQVSRQNAEGGVKVTFAEGGVLQSFPPDYPWQGSRTAQYQQVGNAIPPRLAAHILGALTHVPDYQTLIEAAYQRQENVA